MCETCSPAIGDWSDTSPWYITSAQGSLACPPGYILGSLEVSLLPDDIATGLGVPPVLSGLGGGCVPIEKNDSTINANHIVAGVQGDGRSDTLRKVSFRSIRTTVQFVQYYFHAPSHNC